MGASLVLRDSATPLKGRGLTVLLWVRRDNDPAQGEKLTYLAVLCVHPVQLNVFQEVQVYSVYKSLMFIFWWNFQDKIIPWVSALLCGVTLKISLVK